MVLQKLPFRLYVGLELLSCCENKRQVAIEIDSKSYSLKDDKFEKDQYEYLAQLRLIEFLNRFLTPGKKKQSFKIHLLSEIPFGGSGSAGALCAALATAVSLQNKRVAPKNIKGWAEKKSPELFQNQSAQFEPIFRLGWKMMVAYRDKETSGAGVFTSLLSSRSPIFYYLEQSRALTLPLEVKTNYSLIDKARARGGRISELFDGSGASVGPIDFGLLYLGEPRGTAPYSTRQLEDNMRETAQFMEKRFKGLSFSQSKNLWSAGLEVMNFLSCQVLINLGKALEEGARDDVLRALLRAIDKHQALFLLLGLLPGSVDSVSSMVHHQARKIDDLGAGLKSVSTTKKDIILFVFPHARVRQVIPKTISEIEKELGIDLQLGYASWLDGIEEEGVRIEQSLEQKIYSDFISKETIFIREFNKNGKAARLPLTPEEFEKKRPKIDILLEEESGRIQIRGETITSKELHSSKATVGFLKILLQTRGKAISNSTLPRSSYSIDRYELQGKIVSPLRKAFERRTKKKLPLRVKGGITDFTLKLDCGNFTAWLKEKN